jgi:ferredoxin-NADP reductase
VTQEPIKAKVINRQMLTDTVMEFSIETYQEVDVVPGQWGLFLFEDQDGLFERSYSIVDQDTDNEKTMLIFAIKLSEHGRGSAMIRKTPIGSEVNIKGIFGNFIIQDTQFPKVFIGT